MINKFEMFCESINNKINILKQKILNDIYDIKKLKNFKKISKIEYHDMINNVDIFEKDKLYPKYYNDRVIDNKYWGFHASYFDVFNVLNTLLYILQKNGKNKPKLIDIGCGIGNVIKVTNIMGFDSSGIELSNNLKEYHEKFNLDVKYGDIFDNMNILSDKDVIYLYQPFYDDDLEVKFLNKLFYNTKDDVVVVYTHLNESHLKWEIVFDHNLYDSDDIYTYILMKK